MIIVYRRLNLEELSKYRKEMKDNRDNFLICEDEQSKLKARDCQTILIAIDNILTRCTNNNSDLIKEWLKIAQNNYWIKQRGSCDPNCDCAFESPLQEDDFYECLTIEELYNELTKANWVLGQPFYYQNLCFINQINAGDEFLVIRDTIEFESITASAFSFEKFSQWIERVFKASEKQLKELNY